jgi:hypothetical protein
MPSEKVANIKQDAEPNKNRSDIILWLLASALAIVLFLVEKTQIWTVLFLVALVTLLFHPIKQIPWIRSNSKRRIAALGVMVLLVICFGFAIWPKQNRGVTGPTYAASVALTSVAIFLTVLRTPEVQYGLCVVFGMLLMALLQKFAYWIRFRQKINISSRGGVKGFLDYKMQAESGMKSFSPKLNEISNIVANVGSSLEKHTKRVQSVLNASTRIQMRRVIQTARMLDRYSGQLDKKGTDLEAIAEPLAEGIEEWLKWASKQPNGMDTKQELEGSMRPLVETMKKSLESTNVYIENTEALHGVSRDMNGAIDRHIDSMTRIRNTNEKLLRSCLEVLRHFDAMGNEHRVF